MIGGYDSELFRATGCGVLANFEVFNSRTRRWTLFDDPTQLVNVPRINASACKCGPKHIYLFGGMSGEDEILNVIERYNMQLKIWTVLEIQLPCRIANSFAFSFSPDYIIILGGLLKKQE